MATILNAFRTIIDDSVSPYQIADSRALRFLDSALDALSHYVRNTIKETISVDSTDITNGYFITTYDIESVIAFYPYQYDYTIIDNRIKFVDSDDWSVNDYDIEYNAYYKRFDGEDRDDSYFDYPKRAEEGLLLWALGSWMDENTTTKADGSGAIIRKSEQNMMVEYLINGEGGTVTSGDQARKKARQLWASLPNAKSAIFSVSSFAR